MRGQLLVMGHHPKEHQAEQEQSEVLEMDNPMEVSFGEYSSWTFFQQWRKETAEPAGGTEER